MEKPRQAPFEPIEPDLTGQPFLREVGEHDPRPIPSVCAALHEARLRAGYDLTDVANVLRIQLAYLEALEDGRFGELPGTTYAVGFLRSYAGFLGLDADEIVGAYKREIALDTGRQRLAFPVPTKEGPRPKFWLILVVLVLAGLAYGGWQYYASEGRLATDLVADVSNKLTEAAGLGTEEAPAPGGAPEEGTIELPPAPAATTAAADDTRDRAGRDEAAGGLSPDESPVDTGDFLPLPPSRSRAVAGVPSMLPQPIAAATDSGGQLSAVEGAPVPTGEPRDVVPLEAPRSTGATLGETAPRSIATNPAETPSEPMPETPALAETQTLGSGGTVELGPPVAPVDVARGGEAPVDAEVDADPTAAPAYVPAVFGRGNLDSRVIITARADSWVQVQGPDNELLLTRILRPGDSYRVPDRPGLVMVTGNAGGLEIRVDDKLAPAIGPVGVVRRNIALDPDLLMVGAAAGN